MKKLIRNAAILLLGLSLTAYTASAGAYNLSVATQGWQGIYQDGDGGSPSIPAGAGIGWHAYAYGWGANASVYVNGGGIYANVYAPVDGSDGGSGTTAFADQISILMYCEIPYQQGGAGAGVTINW